MRIGWRVEVNDLHGCVHASISAARSDHFNFMVGDDGQALFHDLLNTARVVLRLPTGEVASVVFEA